MNGAQRRIAAAAALQTEAALRAVSGARDGPLEKARARELSMSLRCVPQRISPGRRAQGGTAGDWEQVPHHALLQQATWAHARLAARVKLRRSVACVRPVVRLGTPKGCVYSLFPTMKKAAVGL